MDARISSSSGKETAVSLRFRVLPPDEKRRNALKGLGFFWGLAVLSAPLPPIHWVTVPGFFLFGIYWGFRRLRELEHTEELRFPCPECGQEAGLPAQVARNPLPFVCPACRYGLTLAW